MWTQGIAKRRVYGVGICLALTSCKNTGPDCGSSGPDLSEYRIDEYAMQFTEFFSEATFGGVSSRPYAPATVIDPLDFALVLDGEVKWLTYTAASRDWFRFSWLAEAYACSLVSYEIPVQRLVRYEIASTAAFADFPPGTDIAPLFIEEYRNAPVAALISSFIDGGISETEIPPMRNTLRLAAMPLDAEHVFTITIELDDGSYYEFVSPRVTFELQE